MIPSSARPNASPDPADLRIAAFVSPHGFGRAARSSAVMSEIRRQSGAALEIDLAATLSALQSHVPFDAKLVRELATSVQAAGCRAVLCDIAPLGIAVAEEAGLPSVLVESFTWPWLYRPHFGDAPGLEALAAELDAWSDRATVRVQATPVCERRSEYELVRPISRPPRMLSGAVRSALGVESDSPMVVVTMGGYGEELTFLNRLRALPDTTFLITGVPRTGRDGNLRLFDNNTPLFMPDVLRAADAVIAKLGYGRVAEVWSTGLPFGHVTRPDSREMPSLEDFAAEELADFLLTGDEFAEGTWIARLPALLAMTRRPHEGGGAGRVAAVVLELVAPDAR